MSASTTHTVSASDSRIQMGTLSSRVFVTGMAAGVVGLGAAIVMAFMDSENGAAHFWRAYLVGFLFVLAMMLGGYFFTGIQHATRAGWSVPIRRLMEVIAANSVVVLVLFIPLAIHAIMQSGADDYDSLLWRWMHPDKAESSSLIQHKSGYLNLNFWLIRAVAFFAVWIIFSRLWFGSSVKQDQTGDVRLTHRMQFWAPVGMLLFALTLTFAAFDWVMSIEAEWFSTMFGVYFFAISCCTFCSTLILLVFWLQRNGRLQNEITLEHWQDMGKMLFAFGVVFHAYIAFSQFMLIWYANIPEETTWFMVRMVGGWKNLFLLLAFGHFAIPFLLLVTKHTKRIKPILAGIAVWMLVMTFIELILAVHPEVPIYEVLGKPGTTTFAQVEAAMAESPEKFGWSPGLIDLAAFVGLAGIAVAFIGRRLGTCALVPVNDPRLHEGLAFENM